MSATAKFYSVTAFVLIAIVGISFWLGYRSGYGAGIAANHAARARAAHVSP